MFFRPKVVSSGCDQGVELCEDREGPHYIHCAEGEDYAGTPDSLVFAFGSEDVGDEAEGGDEDEPDKDGVAVRHFFLLFY